MRSRWEPWAPWLRSRSMLEYADELPAVDTYSHEAVIVGVQELDADHVRLIIEDPA